MRTVRSTPGLAVLSMVPRMMVFRDPRIVAVDPSDCVAGSGCIASSGSSRLTCRGMPQKSDHMFVRANSRTSTGGRCFRVLLLLAAAALCCGCAPLQNWLHNGLKVGPEYLRPATPVAQEWIDFNEPRVISDAHGVDHAAWWRTFGDPVMDNLVNVAYYENLPLRVAGLRVLEAQAQRAIAAGLFFPQTQQAFGNYQRIQISKAGSSIGIDPNGLPIPRAFDNWTSGFNVGWELDVWGKFRRNLESAEANLDASVENYDDVLVCLIADTATAYVEMRNFQQRLDYARDNVKSQMGSLEIADARFRAGATSKLDVTQAHANVGQTKALIPILESGLRQANNRLCVLLGTPPRDLRPELGSGPIPSAPADVVVGIPAELLRRRPDIREAEREKWQSKAHKSALPPPSCFPPSPSAVPSIGRRRPSATCSARPRTQARSRPVSTGTSSITDAS